MNLGLTGGIGCGKTSALSRFEENGWRTVNTDLVAREFLEKDAAVKKAVLDTFGEMVFQENGEVNRGKLGTLVFSDPKSLDRLERILHPPTREHWLGLLRRHPHENWIVEIPLLFEKKLESHFDIVICMHASDELSDQRLRKKGLGSEAIRLRRSRQLPLSFKMDRADCILSNNGSIDFLFKQIDHLCALLEGADHPSNFHVP